MCYGQCRSAIESEQRHRSELGADLSHQMAKLADSRGQEMQKVLEERVESVCSDSSDRFGKECAQLRGSLDDLTAKLQAFLTNIVTCG